VTSAAARARLRTIWLVLGWAGVLVVAYFSLIPHPPELKVEQGDKIQHFLAYGSLMLWFSQIMVTPPSRRLAGAAMVALGIGLEFAQSLTGYRFYSYADMGANTLGVLLGWLAAPPRGPRLFDFVLTRMPVGLR